METPTARVMKEKRFRIGAGQVDPYRYYYVALSPAKGLEIDGRITEILGVQGLADSPSYGNYKDKAVDIKYQFLEEGKFMPALAAGIMDPQGTRIYTSQYVVASKQIYPFDFTIGLGNGRFGKRSLPAETEGIGAELFTNPRGWLRDARPFGGVQFAISDKYALMLEYNPIKYEVQVNDPAQSRYFTGPVPSQFNYGFRWKPFTLTEIDVSYQRGDSFGISLSMGFDVGQPLIPIYDHPYKESAKERVNPLEQRLANVLYRSGFRNIGIRMKNGELWIEAQNDKYFYAQRAIGVILKTVNDLVPDDIRDVHVILTQNQIPVVELTSKRSDLKEYYSEKLTLNEFLYLSKIRTDTTERTNANLEDRKYFSFGIKPDFHPYFESREGFFKYRLGASIWTGYHPWKGMTIVGGVETYPLRNVPRENVGTSRFPVRSDVALYLQNNIMLGRLMFDQIFKMTHEIYGRFSGGLLEYMYAGVDGEIARPLLDGRFFVGLSGSIVRQRDPDSYFGLRDSFKDVLKPAFFNMRLNLPEIETSVDAKIGQFLAGDKGTRIAINKFINGITLSVWYSWTNTTMFNDSFNKGYHDKGVSIKIPIRLFSGSDSKSAFDYNVSPWTRDVAQDIDHYNTLFDLFGRNTKIYLDKDKAVMYK
jgi:hypothetical protein